MLGSLSSRQCENLCGGLLDVALALNTGNNIRKLAHWYTNFALIRVTTYDRNNTYGTLRFLSQMFRNQVAREVWLNLGYYKNANTFKNIGRLIVS